MTVIRNLILTVAILGIIFAADNWPKPVKAAEAVPYCRITYKAAGRDIFGNWQSGWVTGYGPCSLLDRYEEI